jgi:peptidoglycan/LPS O-acetylase OafA/YrhL
LGWVGVPIFFTVSGFCIHLSYQRSRENGFKRFFTRRFFRIYPPYLLAVLFFGLIFGERLGWGWRTHDLAIFMGSLGQLGSHIY